jgi:DnaJ-class molecular chaperone
MKCPACKGSGDVVVPIGSAAELIEDCPWCEGDGIVTPERAAEYVAAKEAGTTKVKGLA